MIDHVAVAVRDLAAAADFYEAVLGALGFVKLDGRATTLGFGKRYSEFWINHRPAVTLMAPDSGASAAAVEAFHAAALAAGGTCDGPPGLRPQHGEGYYAAFIRDLDGNRIEAVTFLGKAE
jgi:catechol 2,3-dioxygenase-like lactoylglutathione lyase family enzyme